MLAVKLAASALLVAAAGMAHAASPTGAYRSASGDFVIIAPGAPEAPSVQRYLFFDGRPGKVGDRDGPTSCQDEHAIVNGVSWPRVAMIETAAKFESDGAKLNGKLIEPANPSKHPLVVMVHGSERTPAVSSSIYPYVLAAQGISVFVYDKRGTGESDGEYTQNFELLADDAAAALTEARTLAGGRFDRAGFYGGSQGGWVAPLAAIRSRADFVAIGFGLVASPVDEDLEQMRSEARAAQYGADVQADLDELSHATNPIVSSHFTRGFEQLEQARRKFAGRPWTHIINGEYSGEMLRATDADLRRVGQARFDNLELMWHYDGISTLHKLKVPLLWVLADDDREAPIKTTRRVLAEITTQGGRPDIFLFPETDHGMFEYEASPDGSRHMTHVTDGYFRLIGDWIKGAVTGSYGLAERLR